MPAQCDTCGERGDLIVDTQGAGHCHACWSAVKDKPGYVAKFRDVYHFEIRRTDPRAMPDEAHTVSKPDAALGLLRDILQGREQESFIMLALDTRHRVTAWREISRGTSDSVMISARDLFRAALMVGATKIVVAHNHPSGDPSPSTQDVLLTDRVRAAGELLDVEVLDHIIVGAAERYFSFAATRGWVTGQSTPLSTGPRQAPELD